MSRNEACSRIERTRGRDERPDGFKGDAHPVVLVERAPADERQPARGRQCATDVLEREDRVIEEHHAEARENDLGRPIERVRGGVGQLEADVAKLRRTRARASQHLFRDVHAKDRALLPHRFGEEERRPPAAATYVHDSLAGRGRGGAHRRLAKERELAVTKLLLGHPEVATRAVPVFDLFAIRGVGGHVESLRKGSPQCKGFGRYASPLETRWVVASRA